MIQIKVNCVCEVLLLLLKKEMHQRELAKELKVSLTMVQSILAGLREANVVDYRVEGKNYVYFIKRNLVARSFILGAENYKLARVLRTQPELEPVFQDIIKKSDSKLILLFGSYAKGTAKKGSDIDLFIETTNQKTKEDVQNIYPLLSVKIGKFNPKDLLIKEIIKNHIIIKGCEEYYNRINFFGETQT